jgi:hypothetical protein
VTAVIADGHPREHLNCHAPKEIVADCHERRVRSQQTTTMKRSAFVSSAKSMF